jgi:hypothetical protein
LLDEAAGIEKMPIYHPAVLMEWMKKVEKVLKRDFTEEPEYYRLFTRRMNRPFTTFGTNRVDVKGDFEKAKDILGDILEDVEGKEFLARRQAMASETWHNSPTARLVALEQELAAQRSKEPVPQPKVASKKKELFEKVYDKQKPYDVYKDVRRLMMKARTEVFIVESYPDPELFPLYIEAVPSRASVKVLTSPLASMRGSRSQSAWNQFMAAGRLFHQQRPLEIRESTNVHDRYLFIDNKCFQLGASLKDAAKRKPTVLCQLQGRNALYNLWLGYFNQGSRLV